MSDLPPPYSSSDLPHRELAGGKDNNFGPVRHLGRIKNTVLTQVQAPVCLLKDNYSYRHDIYLSTTTLQDELSESTSDHDMTDRSIINTIHFWAPDELSSTFAPMAEGIEPDLFSMVQGYQNCGSFRFSREEIQGDGTEHIRQLVHKQLARCLQDLKNRDTLVDSVGDHAVASLSGAAPQRQRPDASAIIPSDTASQYVSSAHSIGLKRNFNAEDGGSPMVHVYKIHMFSKCAEIDPARSRAFHLLFKWAKPQSAYGFLSGFWEVNLIDVINDGILKAGGELMLLLRGVSDQQMEDLRECWQEGTRVQEF